MYGKDRKMENQRPNINQERKKSPRRVGLWQIFAPIAINYAIAMVTEIVFVLGLTIRVMIDYIRETPELSALMVNTELTYTEMIDQINSFFTTEVTDWVLDQVWTDLMSNLALLTIMSAIVSIPIFLWMFRKDKKDFVSYGFAERIQEALWKYTFIIVGSVAVCIALNNLINLSQLSELSSSYAESSEILYSISFPLQLLGWGILSPIAEELIFRGVIYNRLKLMMKPIAAMLWSALIFAAYHGNLVQGVYAGLCGIMFVWMYERYGSIKAPILAHVAINITSVVLTQYEIFIWLFKDPLRVGIITVVSATIAATIFVLIQNNTVPYFELPKMSDVDEE